MSGLRLTLFGSPHLAREGMPLHLRSRKCLALLAYLAVTGVRHRRDRLATLFWPESASTRAQNSLRYTLSLLRKALDGAWLVVDRETVALDGSERGAVDVVHFRGLLARCRAHDHRPGETCPQCLPLLSEAVELVQGDFMAGFTLRDSPQFDDWQTLEGEALRREMAGALERLVGGYAAQGEVEGGIAYAQRWVGLDPLREEAHRCLMRLYAWSGRRSEALRQYEACARLLEEELGVAPDPEMTALYQAIKEGRTPEPQLGSPVVSTVPATPRHNLPVQPTPFVGRKEGLAQIAQRLADPACRLLTVMGPGGIGKSRLAIQAAEEHLGVFRDGVWFVPLAPLDSVELLPSTVMEALDVPRYGSLDPQVQLLNYLRKKHLLLILDNFEHLLEGVGLVTEMLEEAPGLKVLVTSRERLNLREEWLLPLEGMEYPEEEEMAGVGEGDYSALQLFMQCARRVRPNFSLVAAGASWVARVCQLVEGMPLAIELAAPWVRVMRCQEIAQAIERGLGFLATTLRDMPPRHRSMWAVFDHSWGLLSAEERSVLRRLSVFRGGFRREAAEAVVGASLAVLSSLVDKSWLRCLPSGRYEMHELIRQYCAEQLRGEKLDSEQLSQDRERGDEVRDRHSNYYGAFLQEWKPHLFGRRQREAFEEILEDMDNVWAAWNWAMKRGHVGTIGQCVAALEEVAELRGWHYEVNQAFDRAAAKLRKWLDVTGGPQGCAILAETRIVLAEILRSQALECFKLGLRERTKRLCEESLDLLHDAGHGLRQRKAAARAKGLLGWILWSQGDYARGPPLLWEALALYEEVGESRGRVAMLMLLAAIPHHLGQYEEAEEFLQQATAIADDAGDLRYQAWCLANLSEVLCDKGEYDRAGRAAEEALRIRQELGDRAGTTDSLLRLAGIAAALGDQGLARRYYQEGLTLANEVGDPSYECFSLCGLGMVASALGQHAEAKQWFEEGLAIAGKLSKGQMINALMGLGQATCALGEVQRSRECFCQALEEATKTQRILEALDALVGLASLSAREGEPERAVELLVFALHHHATTQATRDRAQELLSQLVSELPLEAVAAATARGQARGLEEEYAGGAGTPE